MLTLDILGLTFSLSPLFIGGVKWFLKVLCLEKNGGYDIVNTYMIDTVSEIINKLV